MTATLLVASHLTAFTLGAVTWSVVTRRAYTLTRPLRRPLGGHHMRRFLAGDRRLTARAAAAVVVLLVGLFVVGFGVQQYLYQRAEDRRSDCVERWGVALIERVENRSDATSRLQQAERRRDAALDRIVFVFTGLRARPPEGSEADLDRVLLRYADAAGEVEDALREVERTRSRNPYPMLECS